MADEAFAEELVGELCRVKVEVTAMVATTGLGGQGTEERVCSSEKEKV